jgi:hypothetical protein
MKKSLKTTLLIAALLSGSSAFAGENITTVDIQIDPDFKNKNIIFVTESEQEEVGIHQAGSSLMSHMMVQPIAFPNSEYPKIKILAFVTDSSLKRPAEFYVTKNTYQFKPGAHIGLSFPLMFEIR